MSSALNLIIARGFPELGTAAQDGYNQQKDTLQRREANDVSIAGAKQNQQFDAEDQSLKMQQHFSQQGQQAEIQALAQAAEELAQMDQNDPKVQQGLKAIYLRVETLKSGTGSAMQGILQPKPQSRGTPVKVIGPDGQPSFAYPDEAVSGGMTPYVAPPAPVQPTFSTVQIVGPDGKPQVVGVNNRDPSQTVPIGAPAPKPGNAQSTRKEFRGLQSVKDYETALPLLVSARKAPDNGYGDLQLIYTAGKVLDPGSVVREGELALTVAAGSPLQRAIGTTRFTTENGGRLTPETRQQLLGMLNERVMAYRQAYDRDYTQYADYARESNIDPSAIVGSHAANAYQGKPGDGKAQSGPKVGTVENGYRFKGGNPGDKSNWVKTK